MTVQTIEFILTVPSIEETQEWYRRVLGWDTDCDIFDQQGICQFGSVVGNADGFKGFNLDRWKGDAESYRAADQHFTALIYVDDVDALYERALAAGHRPDSAPQNQFWGARTFLLHDLNGFALNFAQKTEEIPYGQVQERFEKIVAEKSQ